jgi:hypothetical protein
MARLTDDQAAQQFLARLVGNTGSKARRGRTRKYPMRTTDEPSNRLHGRWTNPSGVHPRSGPYLPTHRA